MTSVETVFRICSVGSFYRCGCEGEQETADLVTAIFSTRSGSCFHVFILLSSVNQYFDLNQFKEKHMTAVSVAKMAKALTFLLPSSASLGPTLLAQARLFLAAVSSDHRENQNNWRSADKQRGPCVL